MKLDLSLMETIEVLAACESALVKETEQMERYKDVMPWKAKRHQESIQDLESAIEKIRKEMTNG